MKFKAIEKICKDKKRAAIFDGEEQWLGDGVAAYVLRGAPLLDKRNILTMFDVPGDKWDDWHITMTNLPESLCFDDTDPGEQEVHYYDLGISYGGKELRLFDTPDGIAAIEEKYLAPIRDHAAYLHFYLRTERTGLRYFAVKDGLLLAAVLLPYDIVSEAIAEEAERFAKQIKRALYVKARNERKKENRLEQMARNEMLNQLDQLKRQKGEENGEAAP